MAINHLLNGMILQVGTQLAMKSGDSSELSKKI